MFVTMEYFWGAV